MQLVHMQAFLVTVWGLKLGLRALGFGFRVWGSSFGGQGLEVRAGGPNLSIGERSVEDENLGNVARQVFRTRARRIVLTLESDHHLYEDTRLGFRV